MAMDRAPPRRPALMRMLAFAGRYGHQSWSDMVRMPITDLVEFSYAVADIMKEESDMLRLRSNE